MLDILTYLLGWASGLFVGVAVGGYFHDFIRFRRETINWINFRNILETTGIFKVAFDYFLSPKITETYMRTRNKVNENSVPRQERCDVPSGQNPNFRNNEKTNDLPFDVENMLRNSIISRMFPNLHNSLHNCFGRQNTTTTPTTTPTPTTKNTISSNGNHEPRLPHEM